MFSIHKITDIISAASNSNSIKRQKIGFKGGVGKIKKVSVTESQVIVLLIV